MPPKIVCVFFTSSPESVILDHWKKRPAKFSGFQVHPRDMPLQFKKVFDMRCLNQVTAAIVLGMVVLVTMTCADEAKQPTKQVEPATNSIGMKLAAIPAGEFLMGSPETEPGRGQDEQQHRVRITKPFLLGVYEVTFKQYREFVKASGYKTDAERDGTGGWGFDAKSPDSPYRRKPEFNWSNNGFADIDDHPVFNVSWNDAVAFCAWLSKQEGKTYRLPTEAEWEYACRAGTNTRYWHGDDPEGLVKVGNVLDASAVKLFDTLKKHAVTENDGYAITAPVGKFRPNAFGLYDMHGNVAEWCGDWYGVDYYGESPADEPQGPATGTGRVFRGGAWRDDPVLDRSAARDLSEPTYRGGRVGFRALCEK